MGVIINLHQEEREKKKICEGHLLLLFAAAATQWCKIPFEVAYELIFLDLSFQELSIWNS